MTGTPADDTTTNDMPDPMEVARALGRLLRIHMPEGTTSSHERMALVAALLDGYDALPEMDFPWIPIPVASWNEGVIEETDEAYAARVAEAAAHGIPEIALAGTPIENIINGRRIAYVRGGGQLTLSLRPAGANATPPTDADQQLTFDKEGKEWEITNQTATGQHQDIGTLHEDDGFLQTVPTDDDDAD